MTTADVKRYIETTMPLTYSYRAQDGTAEVYADPQVPGTFAARFQDNFDRPVHLLFVTGGEAGTTDAILDRTLEEVEYRNLAAAVRPPPVLLAAPRTAKGPLALGALRRSMGGGRLVFPLLRAARLRPA